MSETLPVAERTLSPEEITLTARLVWGTRFDGGSEGLADYLGMNHRNALRMMSGEKEMGAGFSRLLLTKLADHIRRSEEPTASLIRAALEIPRS